jgi:PAS domain S-box-containing protein
MPHGLTDPTSVVTAWQVDLVANATIGVAFVFLSVLIMNRVMPLRRLTSHKLAVAAATVFFCAAIGRILLALDSALVHAGGATTDLVRVSAWWQSFWDVLAAVAALGYLSLRALHPATLREGPVFGELSTGPHLAHVADLELQLANLTAAEAERDTYAGMLRSVIENAQCAIQVKDLDGRYLMANPLMAQVWGLPEEDILGKTEDLVDPVLALLWRANDIRAQVGPYRLEEWNDVFPDGRHYYESVKFPLHDTHGVLYATAGISLDVTEQRMLTGLLASTRDDALAATAAKSTFLATMSHEIRTPLNAVIGMSDLLMETSLDDRQREFVDTVRVSGDALLDVINNILDFSKIESGELVLDSASFDLRDEIEGCLDLVVRAATMKGLELVCELGDSLPYRVTGDVVRLRQIVANLLANAVKFTEHGDVLVSADCEAMSDRQWRVSITVADTGIGIPAEGMDRVFTSFSQGDASTTRLHGGTGLGLAISQRLAHAMQGEVTVTSTEGVGSTFTAVVVLAASLDVPEVRDSADGPSPLVGRSALLVDDNPTTLRVLELQLTGLGMACTTSRSPLTALDLVRDGLRFDVAVIDMHMPQLNGIELGAELRALPGCGQVPFVLLSSLGWRPTEVEASFTAFLTKPVKRAGLEGVLTSVLQGGDSPHRRLFDSQAGKDSPLHPLAQQPLRILLVEDNPVNQRVTQLILAQLGQLVDIVGDGGEAVEAARSSSYDVILMDVQMPRMDGLEATRRIRALPQAHQPYIVAMTAGAQVGDREACADAGMDGYLSKPVRPKRLEGLLAQIIAAPPVLAPRAPVVAEPQLSPVTPLPADLEADRSPSGQAPAIGQGLVGEAGPAPEGAIDDAAADGGAGPAIDQVVFDELMVQLGDDADARVREEVIGSYLTDAEDYLRRLTAAVEASDVVTAGICAHTLRSTSALLGAVRLAEMLQQTEDLAAASPTGDLAASVVLAQAEYHRVLGSLRRLTTAGQATQGL